MKIKSSTPWCNLYSDESKYNLLIGSSNNQRYFSNVRLAVVFLLLIFIVYLGFPYIKGQSPKVLWLLSSGVCLSVAFAIYFFGGKRFTKDDKNQVKLLVLNQNGSVDCQYGSGIQLEKNSRVGWFGCWLSLENKVSESWSYENRSLETPFITNKECKNRDAKLKFSLFIYRDSVSPRNYSRLCRHILKRTTQVDKREY